MSRSSAVDHQIDSGLRFDPLFQAHYDAIYRYCVRRLGRSDAEDAAADVFAVAWRRIDELPPDDKSRAWLFGVAHKVVGNQYRSRSRRSRLSTRLDATATDGGRTESDPGPSDEVELLHEALNELSSNDRELLRLSAWDDLTRSEIAYVLGIRENAVDQRLHRARSRLKTRFDHLNNQLSQTGPKEASA
ncbi:MAG: sigma-70 family RNA polymerase sigma factor [Actinomycetota bacterium]|nr:sigma-70 family RNA polymerase sigma factor [Actinomycetota bacterium]